MCTFFVLFVMYTNIEHKIKGYILWPVATQKNISPLNLKKKFFPFFSHKDLY